MHWSLLSFLLLCALVDAECGVTNTYVSLHWQNITRPANSSLLEVFIIPHSHDDVGWIVTPGEYFESEVQYIYDTVVQQLVDNPDYRFIFVEVAFLKMWWEEVASERQQQQMRQLYANGQIEFIIGGIVMADEAVASYVSRVNQLQEGHAFLLREFGAVPKFGWQIDPFGAARGSPMLFAWDCFDALVIDRIAYTDKSKRQTDKTMEFIWQGTDNLGAETAIFTHVMDQYQYCSNAPFAYYNAWNIYAPPNPNPPINKYNVELAAQNLLHNILQRAAWFQTNNLLWPFGCDFAFQNAVTMFENMNKVIHWINNRTEEFGVHVQFAKLSDYFNAVHKADIDWIDYDYDFLPYFSGNVSFWTGFYTSRNRLKFMARQADAALRQADTLVASALADGRLANQSLAFVEVDELRLQSAVAQHHDAITGTARPAVVADYEARLAGGIASAGVAALRTLEALAARGSNRPTLSFDASVLGALAAGQQAAVVVSNSLAWARAQYVAVPLPAGVTVAVFNASGDAVASQSLRRADGNGTDVWFLAQTPPLGFATYFLRPVTSIDAAGRSLETRYRRFEVPVKSGRRQRSAIADADFAIGNDNYELVFSGTSGLLQSISSRALGVQLEVEQTLLEYNSSDAKDQASGAYIFRNNGTAVDLLHYATSFQVEVASGPLVQELRQTWQLNVSISRFDDHHRTNYTQVFRLFYGDGDAFVNDFFEVWYTVGPLEGNKEMITRFTTPIKNTGILYTDDSGLAVLPRKFDPTQSLPIPGNYYPMVGTAYIEDSDFRFTALSFKSHGCASLQDGELEVMLHRRTLQDDGKGLKCALNDTNRISFPHWFLLDSPTRSEQYRHKLWLMLDNPLTLAYAATTNSNQWPQTYTAVYSPLAEQLPLNVHMLSFQIYNGSSPQIVLRLQHVFQAGSDPVYAVPVTIDLNQLFSPDLVISDLVEMTLSANQPLSSCKRVDWGPNHSPSAAAARRQRATADAITLQPSQIRTFFMRLSPAAAGRQ